jgi:hypothetical protein
VPKTFTLKREKGMLIQRLALPQLPLLGLVLSLPAQLVLQ